MTRVYLDPALWDQILQDFFVSGLSYGQYYDTRLPLFINGGRMPALQTFANNVRRAKRQQASTPACAPTLPAVKHTPGQVAVCSLSTQDIEKALGSRTTVRRQAQPENTTPIKLTLAGGVTLEFQSQSPELLAISLFKLSAGV